MKIESIEYIPTAIERKEEFKIATGSSKTAENVLVKVEGEGEVGWGNAAPNSVTGETTESILKSLRQMKDMLEDRDIEIEEVWEELRKKLPKRPTALAGLDIALHDLRGKLEGKRIFEMFGGKEAGALTDRTMGIMPRDDTVEHASEYVKKGFKALKIKIGLNLMEDAGRISAVREEVGPDIDMWVDANQGYSVQEAITLCQKVEPLDIQFVEQPVKESDLRGLKRVAQETNIPIMADEAMKGPESAEEICSQGMADMVNIKLMKCGGITGGRKIAEIIENHNIDAMVGCMSETVPSIAAAVHLHMSSDNIKYADLDGHFMLSENIATALEFRDSKHFVSKSDGLGISVDRDKIERYRMDLEATR